MVEVVPGDESEGMVGIGDGGVSGLDPSDTGPDGFGS